MGSFDEFQRFMRLKSNRCVENSIRFNSCLRFLLVNSRVPSATQSRRCFLIRFKNNFILIFQQIVFLIIIGEALASTQYTL